MVRAGMDDKEMAQGLGINLPLVSAGVFFLASFLAGFAGVMGSQFIAPNPGLGLDTLLLALVVTIVGGTGAVQGALLGGVLIGVLDTFGKSLFPEFGLFTMYLAMIVILLVRPTGASGKEDQLMSPEEPAPVVEAGKARGLGLSWDYRPTSLRSTGACWFSRSWSWSSFRPLLNGFQQLLMTKFLILAIFGMGYNMVYGYGGMLSLGHGAFFGIGVYAVGLLWLHAGINNLWLSIPVSIIMALIGGLILSFFFLRMSGVYFLLITFGLSQLLYAVAWSIDWFNSSGMQGISDIKYPSIGFSGFSWTNIILLLSRARPVPHLLFPHQEDRRLPVRPRHRGRARGREAHAGSWVQRVADQIHRRSS